MTDPSTKVSDIVGHSHAKNNLRALVDGCLDMRQQS